MFALKSELAQLDREFQEEGYRDFLHDCASRVMECFPDARDFTESDIEEFVIATGVFERNDFNVHEFRAWL